MSYRARSTKWTGAQSLCAGIIWRRKFGAFKQQPGKGVLVGGVKLPLALAELGLIDEYEFIVQPRLAGHGPTLFAGLSKSIDLKLVGQRAFGSGAVSMRYEPRSHPR
jgi:dihydrofolate reductase